MICGATKSLVTDLTAVEAMLGVAGMPMLPQRQRAQQHRLHRQPACHFTL